MKSAASPLDTLPPEEIIKLMDGHDARALAAVEAARKDIARAGADAATAIGGGGRLTYGTMQFVSTEGQIR